MDKIIVNTIKDCGNNKYTSKTYNNRAINRGEIKDGTIIYDPIIDISNAVISREVGRVTLNNKNKNGGEIVDKNRMLEVNITRKYNWNSRDY